MTDRRTMLEWFAYLDNAHRELTLSEFMALMLFHIREYQLMDAARQGEMAEALGHLEGMVGALDDTAARMIPGYPSSRQVREALGARRDDDLRVAAEQRRTALGEGTTS